MLTEESRLGSVIYRVVSNPVAARLFYQAQIHILNLRSSSELLQEEFDHVLFHDIAQSQSCHLNDGIFGMDEHIAARETSKLKTWGALMNTVTAAHRFLRSVVNARNADQGRDWKVLREPLKTLPTRLKQVRDCLEHLDEAVHRREVTTLHHCNFTPYGVLILKGPTGTIHFDFTEAGLQSVTDVWGIVVHVLEARDSALRSETKTGHARVTRDG